MPTILDTGESAVGLCEDSTILGRNAMRLAVITQIGSGFGIRLLNQMRWSKVGVEQVVVLSAATRRRFQTLRGLARRMGWIDAVRYLASDFFRSPYVHRARVWRGRRLETAYQRLARRVDYTPATTSPETVRALTHGRPDLLLIGHCGILPPAVLDVPRWATINAHPGVLPDYRGNDTDLWAIWKRRFDRVGSTLHVAERRVDAGPILELRPYRWCGDETLERVRTRLMEARIDLLVEACLADWPEALESQRPQEEGRLHFAMSPGRRREAARHLASFLAT